jgi:hypothetical protein
MTPIAQLGSRSMRPRKGVVAARADEPDGTVLPQKPHRRLTRAFFGSRGEVCVERTREELFEVASPSLTSPSLYTTGTARREDRGGPMGRLAEVLRLLRVASAFVSYAHEDQEFVLALIERLQAGPRDPI